ncbi:hypothetical protein QFZ82_004983 [Streptomyces sp. V4I23]|nr:hypothetical protein [Streptomyces sp. V4I23]
MTARPVPAAVALALAASPLLTGCQADSEAVTVAGLRETADDVGPEGTDRCPLPYEDVTEPGAGDQALRGTGRSDRLSGAQPNTGSATNSSPATAKIRFPLPTSP